MQSEHDSFLKARMKLKTELLLNKLEEIDLEAMEQKDEVVGKKLRKAVEGLQGCLGN